MKTHITRDTDPRWLILARNGEWLEAAKEAALDQEAPRDFALTAALIANAGNLSWLADARGRTA